MINTRKNYYWQMSITVIDKWRWSEKREEFPVNVEQTRQKFKRCINICRDAVMKVKIPSGIRHFQHDKETGSWFGKLLPILSSMDICQHQQAIEPGIKASETNGQEANPEESHDDVCEEEGSQGSSSRSSDGAWNAKRKYVLTSASRKKSRGQTESLLTEIKETMNTLKTLASDTSYKEILDFLNEECQ